MTPPTLRPGLVPPPEGVETAEQLEIMRNGQSYVDLDPYLIRLRARGQELLWEFNTFKDDASRMALMRKICNFKDPSPDSKVMVMPGFTCEYWFNITFGNQIYVGHNCTFGDVAPIVIGDRTMIGPHTQLYTPTHPIIPEERTGPNGHEAASPIAIGNDCWIGGGAIILPGVTIGDGSTVGAGSVVSKSVPPRTVVVGNPARAIKRIEPDGTVVDLRK